ILFIILYWLSSKYISENERDSMIKFFKQLLKCLDSLNSILSKEKVEQYKLEVKQLGEMYYQAFPETVMNIYLHIIVCHTALFLEEYYGNLTPFYCHGGEHLMKKVKVWYHFTNGHEEEVSYQIL